MAEKITKLALTSRIFVLFLQLLANALIPNHNTDVFRAAFDPQQKKSWLDHTIRFVFGGLRHWDGEYFLHIAEHGYTYENCLAFYPLYPVIIRVSATALQYLVGDILTMRSCCLLMGAVLNFIMFCKAAQCMYTLTHRIFKKDLNKSWNVALLFCFNPASIFFSAAYSETLFCLLSLYVMLECCTELRFLRTAGALALNIAARSNGLINIGFLVYFGIRKFVLRHSSLLTLLAKIVCCLIVSLVPFTLFNFYAFTQFCTVDPAVNLSQIVMNYGIRKNFVIAGQKDSSTQSPWCHYSVPFPYSYIQSHYWNVGFLRYYELRQIPNFILAFPILSFLLWHCVKYLRNFTLNILPQRPFLDVVREYKCLPFVLHSLFLTVFCILYTNIQISTRLLCSATPCLYWFAADYMPKSWDKFKLKSKAGGVFLWFTSYILVTHQFFFSEICI